MDAGGGEGNGGEGFDVGGWMERREGQRSYVADLSRICGCRGAMALSISSL